MKISTRTMCENATSPRWVPALAILLILAANAVASNTEFVAKVKAVRSDGALSCKLIRFLKLDSSERKEFKGRGKLRLTVDVVFNEIAIPGSRPFRAQAVAMMHCLCVGHMVTVKVGRAIWQHGKVVADVELNGLPGGPRPDQPSLQMLLVEHGLGYSLRNMPPDDILVDAESNARARRIGMWSAQRHG